METKQTILDDSEHIGKTCSQCGIPIFPPKRKWCSRKCGSIRFNSTNSIRLKKHKERYKTLAYIVLANGIIKCTNPQCTSVVGNIDHLTFGHLYSSGGLLPNESSSPKWIVDNQHGISSEWMQLECFNCNCSEQRHWYPKDRVVNQ